MKKRFFDKPFDKVLEINGPDVNIITMWQKKIEKSGKGKITITNKLKSPSTASKLANEFLIKKVANSSVLGDGDIGITSENISSSIETFVKSSSEKDNLLIIVVAHGYIDSSKQHVMLIDSDYGVNSEEQNQNNTFLNSSEFVKILINSGIKQDVSIIFVPCYGYNAGADFKMLPANFLTFSLDSSTQPASGGLFYDVFSQLLKSTAPVFTFGQFIDVFNNQLELIEKGKIYENVSGFTAGIIFNDGNEIKPSNKYEAKKVLLGYLGNDAISIVDCVGEYIEVDSYTLNIT